MIWKPATLLAVVLITSIVASAEEVVSERKIGFQSEYDDGGTENMVIRYSAVANLDYHQIGSASKGIDHLQDTRRCEWEVYSYIQRDLCISTRTAGEICEGKHTRIFNDGRAGGSKSQDIFAGRWNATTCEDMMGEINKNYEAIKAHVISQLKPVMDSDVDELFDTLHKSGGVKRAIRK